MYRCGKSSERAAAAPLSHYLIPSEGNVIKYLPKYFTRLLFS